MFRQLLERSFEDFEVQLILAFEMIIDGCLIDASFDDDVARSHPGSLSPRTDGRRP